MKFLFKYNIIIVHIGRIPMMFEIFIDHLVGDIARAPYSIAYRPKVTAPVFLAKGGEFLLKATGRPSLKPFHKVAQLLRRTVPDMYVDMVLTYGSLKDAHVLRITDLLDKVAAPDLHIALENVVSIFRDPYDMRRQPRYGMARSPLFVSHSPNIEKCVATESLALKCIVSTNDCDQ